MARTGAGVQGTTAVTLMYEGWQVWDGVYGPVRVGSEFVATVEFAQLSSLTAVEHGSHFEHLDSNRYRASAKVLDTDGAIVLDFGPFRALRWVRPGEDPGDFKTGTTVGLEVSFGLNAWDDSSWTNRADEMYGTEHRWLVEKIRLHSKDGGEVRELKEASTETVESSGEYCLLTCSLA